MKAHHRLATAVSAILAVAGLAASGAIAQVAPPPIVKIAPKTTTPAPKTKAAARPAAASGENIAAPVPPGFKLGHGASNAQQMIAEYIPAADTPQNWTTMITVQILRGDKTMTPDAFAEDLANHMKADCAGAQAQKGLDAVENGYPISIWNMYCPLNPATKKPQSLSMKIIRGQDALYSVQYAFPQAPTHELVQPAMDYLGRVTVCDTRRADRPCPPGFVGAAP